MAEIVKVNTARMKADMDKFEAFINELQHLIDVADADASKLEKMWDGENHDDISKAIREKLQTLRKAVSGMDTILEFEESARAEFDKCCAKVDDVIAGI